MNISFLLSIWHKAMNNLLEMGNRLATNLLH